MQFGDVTIDFKKSLPIFPLPDSVLLPSGQMPLHIFEPRYRAMTSEALDSFGLIAMGTFDGPVSQEEYWNGFPALKPSMCAASIRDWKKLPDGRYLIVLVGLCRVRLLKEEPNEPYRRAFFEPTEPEPVDESLLSMERAELLQLLSDPYLRGIEDVRELRSDADGGATTTALIDRGIMLFASDVAHRYQMLEEVSPAQRAAFLFKQVESVRELIQRRSQN